MDEVISNAILDLWERGQEVNAAFEQLKQRGKKCQSEFKQSLRRLADDVSDAKAKEVPAQMITSVLLELPQEVQEALVRVKRELERSR